MPNNLKKLREERNLSLRELSKETGLDYSFLSKMEKGTRTISPENLAVLSDFYDVSYAVLLDKTEDEIKKMNLPKLKTTRIDILMRNTDFKSEVQKECFILLNYILEEGNLETIRDALITMLKKESIKHNTNLDLQKLRERYLLANTDSDNK